MVDVMEGKKCRNIECSGIYIEVASTENSVMHCNECGHCLEAHMQTGNTHISPFTLPVKHIGAGMIMDAKNRHLLDIRGWGWLESTYGTEQAEVIQDTVADAVVKILNTYNHE